MTSNELHWLDLWLGRGLLWRGLQATLMLATIVSMLASLGGLVLAVCRSQKKVLPLQWLASAWIEGIRSLPLMLFLVLIHYGVMPVVSKQANFWQSAIVAFSLFEAVYLAEIIRGGLQAVTTAERTGAKSLGLTPGQQLWWVVFPLAFQRMQPALLSQAMTLLKDSSLASVVGVIEFSRAGEILYEQTYHEFEVLVCQALVYALLCWGLAGLIRVKRRRTVQTG
jgi:His/Glu/Gln/Arg/opine family amino acid ABC transporter permease subunit